MINKTILIVCSVCLCNKLIEYILSVLWSVSKSCFISNDIFSKDHSSIYTHSSQRNFLQNFK